MDGQLFPFKDDFLLNVPVFVVETIAAGRIEANSNADFIMDTQTGTFIDMAKGIEMRFILGGAISRQCKIKLTLCSFVG